MRTRERNDGDMENEREREIFYKNEKKIDRQTKRERYIEIDRYCVREGQVGKCHYRYLGRENYVLEEYLCERGVWT